ncbi:ABC transporter ATP-binding protein [Romboutsia weinsteinii]|uniref:ABC transporter ATP-binding protein n=1 Tax=Romboutsia weinsteinii TaxID=2020949 RepID=A0A371IZF9_9FIRM|nr:ATP-binding cassette domain-containing protein [Romboutsia weinsteinii]RDY25854.1 ABC transporter ATP-binding protein [Romboutsia weinsteinii]
MEEIKLRIKNMNKKYNDNIIFDNFDIEFDVNKVNCIVGKSGCGKSTLLNIVSGIVKNDSEDFKTMEDLGISYIFQEDRLIEWLNVEENIKFVLDKKYKKEVLERKLQDYLDLAGIIQYKKYYPQMLSGGIRQRVNIVRALIYPSKVIIMDEPFKSIDIKNKNIIMEKLKYILKKEVRTVLFVTHDIDEALFIADKIYVLGGSPVKVKGVLDNNSIDKNAITDLI